MPLPVLEFFRYRGLHRHPFLSTNGEEERDMLPNYFVRVEWFDQLVGQTTVPTSILLFAPRGYGKTSHRIEVGRIASEQAEPALVVPFIAFDRLLQANEAITTDLYVRLIEEYCLKALEEFMRHRPVRREQFQSNPPLYHLYFALLELYLPLLALEHGTPAEYNPALPQALRATPMGALERLKRLSKMARASGCASIYFLIDGVDEDPLHHLRSHPETIVDTLSPLLAVPNLLQDSGIAFKFFLPEFVRSALENSTVCRIDRYICYQIRWNDKELRQMLANRLTAFSRINPTSQLGTVNRFNDLVEQNGGAQLDADALLVQVARGSPRTLITRAREVIETHCKVATDLATPISPSLIIDALNQFSDNPDHAHETFSVTGKTQRMDSVQDQTPQIPSLHFDERGDIWLDDIKVTNRKPLTKMQRACMEYLWQNRGRTVRYEELASHLYATDLEKRADPIGSADKRVEDLRKLIKAALPGVSVDHFIARQHGTGYVLSNFTDILYPF